MKTWSGHFNHLTLFQYIVTFPLFQLITGGHYRRLELLRFPLQGFSSSAAVDCGSCSSDSCSGECNRILESSRVEFLQLLDLSLSLSLARPELASKTTWPPSSSMDGLLIIYIKKYMAYIYCVVFRMFSCTICRIAMLRIVYHNQYRVLLPFICLYVHFYKKIKSLLSFLSGF